MHRRMSNLTKDKLKIIGILLVIVWVMFGAIYYIFAQPTEQQLTDIELMNKYYVEQNIQTEMRYLAMWEYTENMTPEEYIKTFFSKEAE